MLAVRVTLSALLLAASAGLAVAASCQDELKAVDSALDTAEIAADQKTQARDMRTQAADLCKAGNEEEALDVLAEVKALLGLP